MSSWRTLLFVVNKSDVAHYDPKAPVEASLERQGLAYVAPGEVDELVFKRALGVRLDVEGPPGAVVTIDYGAKMSHSGGVQWLGLGQLHHWQLTEEALVRSRGEVHSCEVQVDFPGHCAKGVLLRCTQPWGSILTLKRRLTDLELRFNRYVKLLMVPHSAPPSVIEEGPASEGAGWNELESRLRAGDLPVEDKRMGESRVEVKFLHPDLAVAYWDVWALSIERALPEEELRIPDALRAIKDRTMHLALVVTDERVSAAALLPGG